MEPKDKSTQSYREYATVSDAALILGVSIDTVRRWEKAGKLHAKRLDGKNRYFLVDELHRYKSMQPLSTSEVASLLNVSQSTVRRLEDQGLLKPMRNDHGKRLYDRETVDAYLRERAQEPDLSNTQNFSPAQNPQVAYTHAMPITAPIPRHTEDVYNEAGSDQDVEIHRRSIARAVHGSTYKLVQRSIVYTVTIGLLLISLFTFVLIVSPASMSRLFWINSENTGQQSRGVIARVLQPFADRALNVVDVINPGIREQVQPVAVTNVTELFSKDENGNITTTAGFSPPSSSYLKIPDSNLVVNLNSDYVQGQQPGNSEGDLALLPITSSHIKDDTITSDDIAAGTILLGNLSAEVLNYIGTNQQQPVQQVQQFSGINGITAGAGLAGGGSSGTPTISLQTGLSTEIISGGVEVRLGTLATATTASVSGLEVSSGGLQLIGGCGVNQLLKWDGSNWQCASDVAGGGSFDVQEGGSTVTSPVAAINFSANDFSVTDNVGQANVVIDYATSGITRRNQNETIAGTWSFGNASFNAVTATSLAGSGSGITALNASNISGGTLSDSRLSNNVTTEGNVFNGNSQLVQTTAAGLLPALNGSLVTNINASTLGGQAGSYYLDLANATGTLSAARVADGSLANVKLQNSSLTVNPGTGLSGGGSVSLGGSTTLNLANTTVTAASYGSASAVSVFTVDAQGRLTTASSTPIAINGSNIANNSVALGTQTTGNYVASIGTVTGLTVGSNTGEGSTPSLGVTYGSLVNTSVQGNTQITCASGTGNLSGGGNAVTLGAGGSCNNLSTNNAVSFSTSVTTPLITNAGALSVTATGVGNNLTLGAGGSIILSGFDCTGSANGGVLTTDASGTLVCDDDDGGAGGSISGSGTTNRIPLFSGSSTIASSWLAQNGSDLELDATRNFSVLGGNLDVTGAGTFSGAVDAASFTGSGASLTALNASNISTGTLNDARLSGNVTLAGNAFNGSSQLIQTTAAGLFPALNGSLITNVNAATLGSQSGSYYLDLGNATGSLNDARLSSNVTLAGNTFNGVSQLVQLDGSGALPALDGSALTGLDAATLGGQNGAYYLDLSNATGTLAIARIADSSITNAKLQNSGISTSFGTNLSGSASVVLGGTLTVNMSATPSFTSVSATTFTGALSGNASTATALAANPTDCAADTYATAVAANGNLTCTSITDAALSTNVTKLGATITKDEIANSGVLGFTWGDSEITDTLTIGASSTVADAALSSSVTLGGNTFNGNSQLVQTTAGGALPALNGSALTSVNAAQLGGQAGSYYLDLANATGTLNIARIADSSLTNAKLQNSAVTVSPGTGLSGGGSVSLGSSTSLSVAYGASAGTAVQGNTSITCASGTGNLTGGGNSITLGTGGTCNAISTNAAVSFGTSVTTPLLTNAGQLTLSATGAGNDITITTADKLVLTGFNCTTFDNGGVLSVNASGEVVCDNDDGGAAGTITGSGTTNRIPLYTGTQSLGSSWLAQSGAILQLDSGRDLTLLGGTVTATTFTGALSGNATTATALATNPADCSANQFATTIAANGDLTCAALTDGDIPNSITVDLAAAATALAANPTDCSSNQFATTIAANGNLACASITDADVSDTLTASLFVGSGSATTAIDLATAEVAGNLRATNLQNAAADLGAANVTIDLSNTNGSFVTNFTVDGTITATTFIGAITGNASTATALAANPTDCSANQFATAIAANGNLTCAGITDGDVPNSITIDLASTATALAANPADCSANQFATTIAANGNLTCATLTDGDIPDSITISLAAAATALAANPADCSSNQFANAIAANGNLTCASITDADVSDTLTASLFIGSGSATTAIDLATAEVAGNLRASNLQSAAADLGAADVTINLGNTNGAFNTNLTLDGTVTATTFIGAVTGNALTATALAANPADCSANQFANAIASNGNLTCATLTDGDIPNSITIDLATAATALAANPSDCSANQFANAIAASGNLTCAALTDGDIPDSITISLSATATALAANPSDCAANQFATTIAASGNLTCASITDADVSNTLTASLFVGSGSTTSAIDLATAEVAGNLLASNLQNNAADLGAADVTINLGNTNGAFNTNLTLDGTVTAATFIGAVTGNASTATALAANPTDCAANQFATTIAASGNLTCAALTDGDIPDSITISLAATATALAANPTDCSANQFANAIAASGNLTCAAITDADVSDTLTSSLFVGSGSATTAIDLATAEIAGNLRANNFQNAAADLGAADVTINLGNTNGSFNTNLTLDGTVTATTLIGALTGNASTATALAANPSDCAANQFATTIAASGNLSCAALTDGDIPNSITIDLAASATVLAADPTDCSANMFANAIAANGNLTCAALVDGDIPNSITIDLAAAATALASNPTDCSANQFANAIAASGNLTCAAITDADVSNTLTSSLFVGSGSTTTAIDLATSEIAGNLMATNLQSAGADLGAANVTVDLTNTNGAFVTNFTLDGTITAAAFAGALTGNASTATALAANPDDCAANTFANAIAASGNLTCAAITDADVSNTLTASLFVGSGSTTSAIDLATAEVAGILGTGNISGSYTGITGTGALAAGSISSGFGAIDTGADTIQTSGTVEGGIVNATTGIRLSSVAATGEYLRGDGTNFVSSALLASDISGYVFGISADAGTDTIIYNDTFAIQGGTNGIDTSVSSDTFTLNIDTTEIAASTFGSGSDFIWTFDPSGAANPELSFTNDALSITAASVTLTGDLAVNGGDVTSSGAVSITPAAGTNLNVALSTTGDFAVNTNHLYVDTSTARVGLGTAIPNAKLSLGNDQVVQKLLIYDNGNTRYGMGAAVGNLYTFAGTGGGLSFGHMSTVDGTTYTERAKIDGTGNLGVGISGAAGGLLSVGGTTGNFTVQGSTGNIATIGDAAINGGDITSTGALNVTPGGALTVGATGQTLTLQGSIASFTSNGAGNDITLTSADQIILNSVGTIELQDSTNITGNLDASGTLIAGTGNAFQVSAAGAVTAVGVNSGAGLIQGTLGLTVTGAAVNLNASSNFAINIGTGTSTGAVSIGGGSNTFAVASTGVDISTAGAISNATTINASGAITGGSLVAGNGLSISCGNTNYLDSFTITSGVTLSGTCQADGLSDARLKSNIAELGDNILDELRDVRTVNFDFDCDNQFFADNQLTCNNSRQTGVIAQELAEVFPELVYQETDGYYRVKYDQLAIYNLKATIEVAQYIENNESQKIDLDLRMDGLDSRIAGLEQDVADLQQGLSQGGNGQQIDLQDLQVGKLTVSLDLLVSGGLVVSGPAEFRGTTIFDQLVTFGDSITVEGNLNVLGTATFNNNTGGYAVINPGQQTVHVAFSQAYAQQPIINLTLGQGKFAQYSYNNVTANGFDIVINAPATEQLQFSWTATSVANPISFVQP